MQRVPLAALPPGQDGAAAGARIAIEQRAGESRLQVDVDAGGDRSAAPTRFIADTQAFSHPLDAIELPFAAEADFEGGLRIDTSEDLSHWRTLASEEAVVAIGHGASRIVRNRIALPAGARRYLRLVWLRQPPAQMPDELVLVHVERAAPPARRWLELSGRATGEAFHYTSPGRFPVDQVRLLPAAGADVVAAQLASRPNLVTRWRALARLTGFRIEDGRGVHESAPVSIAPTRDPYWQLGPERPETAGAAPVLMLGWVPEEIVFVARGAPPYTLAVGHPDRPPAWLPVHGLVPGYGGAAELEAAVAQIAEDNPPAPTPARADSLWPPGPHWWLWAALGLGIALLGAMARGIWRELGRRKP